MNIKAVIFDADGMAINSSGYFSVQYAKKFGISNDIMLAFFNGRFQECVVGRADIKEELQLVLRDWQWEGTVEELLEWWFKSEHCVDERVVKEIARLRRKGITCCLATNQEKYRGNYLRENMGFKKIFDEIYNSAEIGYRKPEKEFLDYIFKDLARKISIKKDNIMIWDDKENFVVALKALGWQSYLYQNFDDFQKVISQL